MEAVAIRPDERALRADLAHYRTPAEIDRIAQGRVWDGGTARQLGLVDQFGGLDDAIAKAAALANLGDERGITRLEKGPSWEDMLVEMFADEGSSQAPPNDALASLAPMPADLALRMVADINVLLGGPSIQARCLDCPPPAPTTATAADVSLWTLIRRLFA